VTKQSKGWAACGVVLACLAAGPPANAANRRPVAADGPQQARGATDQGATPDNTTQQLRVYLAPNGGLDALKADVAAVSTPGSATYGQFLTPAQFRAKYAPTAAATKAVAAWLKSQGLKVAGTEAASRYLTVTGTASAAESAFKTQLHEYAKAGQTFQAPTETPTVPDDVASSIVAVSGLGTATHVLKPVAQ
jgi:subtilase family serine protease